MPTDSSSSVTTLPWFLILETNSPSVYKSYKFSSQEREEGILPALKPVDPVLRAAVKKVRHPPTLKLCNPYHGLGPPMSVLWSIHHSTSVQVAQALPPSSPSTRFSTSYVHQSQSPCHPEQAVQLLPVPLSLSQAEAEVDAHLRHRHLCRANIEIARGQRSCFVSPFALLLLLGFGNGGSV